MAGHLAGGRLPAAYMVPGTSSFADFLAGQAPDLLPSRRSLPPGQAAEPFLFCIPVFFKWL